MATITIPKTDVELQVKLLRLHLEKFPGMKNSEFISTVFYRGIAAIEADADTEDAAEVQQEVAKPRKRTV